METIALQIKWERTLDHGTEAGIMGLCMVFWGVISSCSGMMWAHIREHVRDFQKLLKGPVRPCLMGGSRHQPSKQLDESIKEKKGHRN